MSELIYRFSFDAAKFNKQAYFCVVVIWLTVLICAVLSIWGQPFSRKQRTFWILVVVGLPLFGLLSYLPFSIRKEDYPGLFTINKKK